jgi:hypothetical protein
MHTVFWWTNVMEIKHLKYRGDGKIILKWTLGCGNTNCTKFVQAYILYSVSDTNFGF